MRAGLALAMVSSALIAAGLVACSSDPQRQRNEGSAGMAVAVAGSGGRGGSGAEGGGSGGVPNVAGASGAGGNAPIVNRGEALEFVPSTGVIPYAIGPNEYGIRGGAFLARSALGNTITVGSDAGEICISGSLDEVPGNNYGQYWGVEVGFNLNQGAPSGGGATDAGADAGGVGDAAPPVEVAQPWVPGNVIGFSFVIEGPTINLVRFKALPAGFDSALESSVYCKSINATSGVAEGALFTEMIQYCWNPTGALLPTAMGLDNISWQLPADVAVGARPFDWCLKDLRPILAE